MKIGLICFANNSGLGNQSRRLAKMIKPDVIMVVDSSGFSQNHIQHYEWYKNYNFFVTNGFPNNNDCEKFLQGLTHIFMCENPYNFMLLHLANKRGIKSYIQSNYEFCDNLDKPYLPEPTKFLMPSHWKIAEMNELFPTKINYLPPPIDHEDFTDIYNENLARTGKKRFLHVIGTAAMKDRNGTLDLIDAVKLSKGDYELVIRSQHPVSMSAYLDDPRVKYEFDDVQNPQDLYRNFDALILPRRWGGLSLTCNEALMAGLPVIMTDISPNKDILPNRWLIKSEKKESFIARSEIEVFSALHPLLADKMDEMSLYDEYTMRKEKITARDIGFNNFSEKVLKPIYDTLWN